MGIMDKIKGLLKGRETQVKSGIDTVSDKAEQAVGPKHAAKVDAVSDKAKDAVDSLTKDDPAPATPAAPAAPVTPPAAATPAEPTTPVPPADVPPTT